VKDLISKNGLRMEPGLIWDEIIESFDGQIDDKNKNMLHTADDGDFYRPTIIGMITDKFGGELDHKRKGNLIQFNQDIFERMGKQYDDTKGIQTKIIDGDSCDACDSSPDTPTNDYELEKAFRKSNLVFPRLETQDYDGVHQYESHGSLESPNEYPQDCYYCDQQFLRASKQEYEKHIVQKHPGRSGYPGQADILFHKLTPKGMVWEK
jgi:hypothetical protein